MYEKESKDVNILEKEHNGYEPYIMDFILQKTREGREKKGKSVKTLLL